MIKQLRDKYNNDYRIERYDDFLKSCNDDAGYVIPFRIAETPIFADKSFKEKVLNAGDEILNQVDDIKNNDEIYKLIPDKYLVNGQEGDIEIVALDFAIIKENENLDIRLIELQGFPSLFAFENYIGYKYINYFKIGDGYSHLFSDLDFESYNKLIKEKLLGGYAPEQVVLLEIDPWNQGTAVDFYYTEKYYGIKSVCLSEIIKRKTKLYYVDSGKEIEIKRIYNRIIIDELVKRQEFVNQFNFYDEIEAEWVVHPNWFVKCSKLMMPYLKSEYIPDTYFLNEIDWTKLNLSEWVLKPIFSFSGSGVVFNITEEDITSLSNPEQYIIQKKIKYEPIIPDVEGGYSKVELRMMYIRKDGYYIPVTNLSRMTKGDLVGVKYNKNKTWVGGNIFLFEK
jgi:hypothetical protein